MFRYIDLNVVAKLQLPFLFFLIFAAPIYSGFTRFDSNYSLALVLATLCFSLPFTLAKLTGSRHIETNNRDIFEVLMIIAISWVVIGYLDFDQGVTDRATVREGVTNVNTNLSFFGTLIANLNFLTCGISAYLIQSGLEARRRVRLYSGIFLAMVTLGATGTRFLFLLAMAPIFYALFFDGYYLRKLLLFLALLVASSFVAISRSGFIIDYTTLLFFDLPSTASAMAVQNSSGSLLNIGNFFIGNILVLIPRIIFPDKPVDPTVIDFTVSVLGAGAFNAGATFLPGFIGSAWLYGGWLGVILFPLTLGLLFLKTFPADRHSSTALRTLTSLLFVGLILQFRNISVFYLLPYMFTAAGLGGMAVLKSVLPSKRRTHSTTMARLVLSGAQLRHPENRNEAK